MNVPRLLRDLERPEAYPHPVQDVDVLQTHISIIALAGAHAYKVRKPVDLGFLDFTTLEKRLHDCEEEVRLNRRLAADIYQGVVPIVEGDGGLEVDGAGTPVEYAVKMERLPSDATLLERLQNGTLEAGTLRTLAHRIARFHTDAASGPDIARYGRWDVVAGNARENLDQSIDHVGSYISQPVHERLRSVLEARLDELRPLIDTRAEAGIPRDTHGDLHLDHVYLFPDREPPRDLVVIDCVEFNERFRHADPVADMAFLAMDLIVHGRRDLANAFEDAYFDATGDADGRDLVPFYVSYRAAVRGKVGGFVADDTEVPPTDREAAARRARTHWLLALSEIEEPHRRPCLVLVGGLPGTGKSTLAGALARDAGFEVIASDEVRKELAGLSSDTSAKADFGEGIYTAEWNDRTYDECLSRATEQLFQGRRVIVDASFREEERRRTFLDAARDLGVRALFLKCSADPATVRERIRSRRNSASDADWTIYQRAAEAWEPEAPEPTGARTRVIESDEPVERVVRTATVHLSEHGLV